VFVAVAPLHYSVRLRVFLFTVFSLVAAPWVVFSTGPASSSNIVSKAVVYPNPFDSRSDNAHIVYTLSEDRAVTLEIYSVFGTRVWSKHIVASAQGARRGTNIVRWDGTGLQRRKVSRGIYLAVLRSGSDRSLLKIGVFH
jgi:hypothetical protein